MRYRLYDGPRDGEVVDELPLGYRSQGTGSVVSSTFNADIPLTAVYDPSELIRLVGGPRGSELVESLPDGYTITHRGTPDGIPRDDEYSTYVARWIEDA